MGSGIRTGAAIAGARRSADNVSSPNLAGAPSLNVAGALASLDPGRDSHCPEIDCIRSLLPAHVIEAAQERAAMLGIGADRVLIANGALSEEDYLRALATSLGVQFEPLDGVARTRCVIEDGRLIEAAAAGLLPLIEGDDLCLVLAPRSTAARRLVQLITESPDWARRLRFTSAEHLNRFILRCAGKAIADRASNALKHKWPELAAGPPRRPGRILMAGAVGLIGRANARAGSKVGCKPMPSTCANR